MKLLQKLFGKGSDEVHFSYEEKRYPLGVLVLLFMMTIVVWMLGQRALQDVSDGIPRIEYPRYFELTEHKAAQDYFDTTVRPLQQQQRDLQQRIAEIRSEYDSSLLENIAGETDRLYGKEEAIRNQFEEWEKKLSKVEEELARTTAVHKELQEVAIDARKVVQKEYRQKNKWRQAKVFAWEALFWIPFFLLSLSWHSRSKRKQSKWEVISLSTLIAASLLSLQSVCVLLWSWIPRALLERLWEILSATLFTRIIGYYVMVGLVVLFFGWFIVFVHRRMTDPVRGGRKKIRQGCCPTCSYPLNLSADYCGGCSKKLKKQCTSCKKDR